MRAIPEPREWARRAWDCRPTRLEVAIVYGLALALWWFLIMPLIAAVLGASLLMVVWPFLTAWLEWADHVAEPERDLDQ